VSPLDAPDGARLTIALDVRDPFSYLALRPALALIEETGVEADWLPIRAHTLVAPSSPSPDDDRGARHRRARARMIAREISIYSEVQGLEIEAPYRDGPADAVHMAWLWIRDAAETSLRPFLEQAFQRYWAVDLDPQNAEDVAGLLEGLELDGSGFQQWANTEGPGVLRSVASQLGEAGVFQAPAYLIDDEAFYGRQHLSMIRWILNGRSGDRPI
jgi:2-hydroxychromene-2-carboxylate isomerase